MNLLTVIPNRPWFRQRNRNNAYLEDLNPVIVKVNQIITGLSDLYQGVLDCSPPIAYPAALKNQYWKVSVAGTIGTTTVEIGDEIICIADYAGGNDDTKFLIVQKNMVPVDPTTLHAGTDNLAFVTTKTFADQNITFLTTDAIKIQGTTGTGIYINKTVNTAGTLKIHCHQLSASGVDAPNHYANEFKGEFLAVASQTTCDGIAAHFHSGASGATIMRSVLGVAYLDSGKTMTGTNPALDGWLNGGMFVADVAGTLAGTTVVAGLYAGIGSCSGGALTTFGTITSLYVSSNRLTAQGAGTTSMIYIQGNPGVGIKNTDYGILMTTGGVLTHGIQLTGILSTASSKSISTKMTIDNANHTDGVGMAEFEMTLTGTTAGNTATQSSWVNLITGIHNAGGFICAQTNGIYEEAACTVTGANLIFGMRMQALVADVDANLYPFSCVSAVNPIKALFLVGAASSDMGQITDAGGVSTKLVPLYKDAGGNIGYVKIYPHS